MYGYSRIIEAGKQRYLRLWFFYIDSIGKVVAASCHIRSQSLIKSNPRLGYHLASVNQREYLLIETWKSNTKEDIEQTNSLHLILDPRIQVFASSQE
jgi:hypothetical protein